jgi:hypothetical protein
MAIKVGDLLTPLPLINRLVAALTEIAEADYRGNRSQESEIAHKALVAEGLRHSPTTTDRKEFL